MEKEDFKRLLKQAGFTKRSFSQHFGLHYQTINTWGNNGRGIPYWVESWLHLYIENEKYKEIKNILKNSGVCTKFVKPNF